MTPRSRHRSPGEPAPRDAPGEVAEIFDGMLHHARELLAVRSPLDAELIVSEILGSWWGHRVPGGDVEEVIGEALVGHAERAATPAALALLTGIAYLGTPRQAVRAERAALKLMKRGVARPGWADRVGTVAPEQCFVSRDVYGDQDSIVCVYAYGGSERHALVVLVDRTKAETVPEPGRRRPRGGPSRPGRPRAAWCGTRGCRRGSTGCSTTAAPRAATTR
ncbi:hypothetical protein [Actinomadura sp. WMMB 499]|uniref:hypothetical protein n=1 Tax=Actinomadura sp. WMMB 499 TaxID=1219491 RepID=UPI0034A0CD44